VKTGSPWYAGLLAALVWPVALLVGLGLLLWTRRGRFIGRQLAGRVGSIDAFGIVGLNLDHEHSALIKSGIEGLIDEYREEARERFARLAARFELEKKLQGLAERYIQPNLIPEAQAHFRCTIYVQDLVFEEGIFQVTNYYPGFKTGAGRVIGKRFGHVGRAFRAGESRTDPNVTTDLRRLMDEFGMTFDEATPRSETRANQSFSCVMITPPSSNSPVGGIYIDASPKNAFAKPESQFEDAVVAGSHEVGLTAALVNVADEIKSVGLAIDVKLAPTR
jgi:hypothetical protein